MGEQGRGGSRHRRGILGLMACAALAPRRLLAVDESAGPAAWRSPADEAGSASGQRVRVAANDSAFMPGIYRGQLGDKEIQVELNLQADVEDSVSGSYFVFGDGAKILLAGEFEGTQLTMEESRNGKDVSGTWSGQLAKSTISGRWQDAEATVELAFHLTRIAASKPGSS